MKKSHILLILAIAVGISVLISSTGGNATYGTFAEASFSKDQQFTLVGQLNNEKPIIYNPKIDPNLVTFHMIDKEGKEFKVVLNDSKPQDMEKSEDIVVKGRSDGDTFYANTILLKCPSKYAEEQQFQTTSIKQ